MTYIAFLIVTVLAAIVATGIIMLVLVYQKKQLQHINEKEQLKASFEREILESKLEMQEQTLKNIAQEIHDNIGQVLSLAKLQVNSFDCSEPAPGMQEKINTLGSLLGKAIHDLRHLSKSLHTDMVTENGLLKSIEYEFDLLRKAGGYYMSLNVQGDAFPLPEQKELILFRIFQEAVHNVIKHAQASTVDVMMLFEKESMLLQIKDDGKGFDSATTSNNGQGLRNIRNRSQLIGARCNISSEPGKGTTIQIELPAA